MDKEETNQTDQASPQDQQQEQTQSQEQTQESKPDVLADDPVMSSFLDGLLGKEPEKEPLVKPANEEQEEPPATDTKEGEPEKEEPPTKVKVVKRKSIQEQIQEELAKSAKTEPPTKTPEPPVKNPANEASDVKLDGLTDEEQDYLDLLNYAAKKAGHKYTDELKKFTDFVNKRNQIKDRILKDDPDADLEDNDTLTKFTSKHRPTISRKEIRDIERMQIREGVEADLKKQYDSRIQEIDNRAKKTEIEPVINAQSAEFNNGLVTMAKDAKTYFNGDSTIPDLIDAMDKEGVEAVRQKNPLFAEIITGAIKSHSESAKEFIKLMKFGEAGMNAYDENNPTHQWIAQFITAQDNRLASSNDPRKVRVGADGIRRTFLPQADYINLPAEQKAKHWTFSIPERLRMIQANAIFQMRQGVEDLRKKLEASGWTKKQIDQQLGSQPPKSGNKEVSPQVKQSVSSGAARDTQQTQNQSVMNAEELAALGIRS